jgi:carbon storage regulator
MLVLSRHANESIMINDDVEIMIVKVQGNKVRLGIKAPRDVAVNRKEIYLKIQEEKEWANLDPNKCK